MISVIPTLDEGQIINDIASYISDSLQKNKRTVWFLSGGSNIAIEVAIISKIPTQLTTKLTIALVDERFGTFNHPDSNYRQLFSAGFNKKLATIIPVLSAQKNTSFTETTQDYNQTIETLLEDDSIHKIAQLGIGTDGHIAGILPNSPIIISNYYVDSYRSKPYDRITLTFMALRKIDRVFLVSTDPAKKDIIQKLVDDNENYNMLPAKILNDLKDVYLYNK